MILNGDELKTIVVVFSSIF